MRNLIPLVSLFLLLAVALTLGGCNAVKGAGTDISQVAQHTQDWMERH